MTPRVKRLYHTIFYDDYDDVEIDQLIIGLLGRRMNRTGWRNTAETVMDYKLDAEVEELVFDDMDNLR